MPVTTLPDSDCRVRPGGRGGNSSTTLLVILTLVSMSSLLLPLAGKILRTMLSYMRPADALVVEARQRDINITEFILKLCIWRYRWWACFARMLMSFTVPMAACHMTPVSQLSRSVPQS